MTHDDDRDLADRSILELLCEPAGVEDIEIGLPIVDDRPRPASFDVVSSRDGDHRY